MSEYGRSEEPVESSSLSCKFVFEGEETYVIGGRPHRLLAGDFLIVDAGAAGHIEIPRGRRTIALSVFLGKSAGNALMTGYGPVMRPLRTGTLGKLLRCTAATYARDPASRPHDATPLVREVTTAVAALADETGVRLKGMGLKKPWSRQELLMRLDKARAYLDENLSATITLADLARVVGMSAFDLNRQFKAVFGEPPMRYRRRNRMAWAADMLRKGEASPSAAAELLNYNDLPTFTRAFKAAIGVPPSAIL